VKDQHMERCLRLLIDELGVYSNEEQARKRIYHVSALEALQLRNGCNRNPTVFLFLFLPLFFNLIFQMW